MLTSQRLTSSRQRWSKRKMIARKPTQWSALSACSHVLIVCRCPLYTGVNPAGDARDTSPPQYFGWGNVNGNIPPILLRTFGYSRPILVAQTLPTEPPKGVRCGEGCSLPTPHPIRWFVPPTLNSRWRHCRFSMVSRVCVTVCLSIECLSLHSIDSSSGGWQVCYWAPASAAQICQQLQVPCCWRSAAKAGCVVLRANRWGWTQTC